MTKKNKNICILGGGWSNEREISLKSSNDVYKSLISNGHNVQLYDMKVDSYDDLKNFLLTNSIDIVFNLIHGEGGEDGKIQRYLDKINVHYCGSDAISSALSFDKYQTKKYGNKMIYLLQSLYFMKIKIMRYYQIYLKPPFL